MRPERRSAPPVLTEGRVPFLFYALIRDRCEAPSGACRRNCMRKALAGPFSVSPVGKGVVRGYARSVAGAGRMVFRRTEKSPLRAGRRGVWRSLRNTAVPRCGVLSVGRSHAPFFFAPAAELRRESPAFPAGPDRCGVPCGRGRPCARPPAAAPPPRGTNPGGKG